jgi:hypothetical protein
MKFQYKATLWQAAGFFLVVVEVNSLPSGVYFPAAKVCGDDDVHAGFSERAQFFSPYSNSLL